MKRRIFRVECLGDTGLPGGENLSMQTSAGKTVTGNLSDWMYRPGLLGQKWKLEVCGKAKPSCGLTGWIRKVKGTVDVLGEVTP